MVELDVKIKEIIQRTHNVKSFRVDIDDKVSFQAGQFLLVKLKAEPELKRYLSISNSPSEKGYLEFTKKITESDFCKVLGALKSGDTLKIQYPFGKFTLEDNPAQKIAFISGGIGITPIRSICKYAVDTGLNNDIVLIYANHSIKDIIFKEDFDAMQKQHPKLKVCHVLCEPAPGFRCTIGLINAKVIKNEIPDYKLRKFFVCGPPAMVEAMKKILSKELLISDENIITENFQGY
jgi:ferredoxin-NADP reductase